MGGKYRYPDLHAPGVCLPRLSRLPRQPRHTPALDWPPHRLSRMNSRSTVFQNLEMRQLPSATNRQLSEDVEAVAHRLNYIFRVWSSYASQRVDKWYVDRLKPKQWGCFFHPSP